MRISFSSKVGQNCQQGIIRQLPGAPVKLFLTGSIVAFLPGVQQRLFQPHPGLALSCPPSSSVSYFLPGPGLPQVLLLCLSHLQRLPTKSPNRNFPPWSGVGWRETPEFLAQRKLGLSMDVYSKRCMRSVDFADGLALKPSLRLFERLK